MIMNEDEYNDEMIAIGEKFTEAMIQPPPMFPHLNFCPASLPGKANSEHSMKSQKLTVGKNHKNHKNSPWAKITKTHNGQYEI